MGYNSDGAGLGWMAFDIETMARADVEHLIQAPDIDLAPEPDKRLTDPVKIIADVEKKRTANIAKAAQKRADDLARLALDVNGCAIAAIGMLTEALDRPAVIALPEDERFMLETFWARAKGRTLVGYYSRQFDLPVIIQRSRYLGVAHPTWRDLTAPYGRASRCVDLFDELTFDSARHDGVIPRNIGTFCELFGLGVPKDDTTGADVAALIAAGDYAAVRKHCEVDVVKTFALAQRLGVIRLQPAGAF